MIEENILRSLPINGKINSLVKFINMQSKIQMKVKKIYLRKIIHLITKNFKIKINNKFFNF